MQNLIIIPGLGDDVRYTKFLTRNWEKKFNIKPHVVAFGWSGDADKFSGRLKRIEEHVDDFTKENKLVSILGISAGGSAVINLFYTRRNKIKKVVTVCGRVRDPNVRKMWNHRAEDLGVFEESIKLCEKNINQFSEEDRGKILTIIPFYDEIVPVRTMTIDGAVSERVFAAQHMVSIALSMSLYSKTIADFLKK